MPEINYKALGRTSQKRYEPGGEKMQTLDEQLDSGPAMEGQVPDDTYRDELVKNAGMSDPPDREQETPIYKEFSRLMHVVENLQMDVYRLNKKVGTEHPQTVFDFEDPPLPQHVTSRKFQCLRIRLESTHALLGQAQSDISVVLEEMNRHGL